MKTYDTLTEAIQDLNHRGYTYDFSLLTEEDCIYCHSQNHSLRADEFVIDEVHRFEGETDPGDEMILYAISSTKDLLKGILMNAYGIYADSNHSKIVEKLQYKEKKSIKPIKRAKALLPLSREHHHGLLLCWKIKTGIGRNIEAARIKKYVAWFYETHLSPHFEFEEKYVFPLLGASYKRKLAEKQHLQIRQIIEPAFSHDDLHQLQYLLNEHIRFEERELFNDIQDLGLSEKLSAIEGLIKETKFCENESDPFWK